MKRCLLNISKRFYHRSFDAWRCYENRGVSVPECATNWVHGVPDFVTGSSPIISYTTNLYNENEYLTSKGYCGTISFVHKPKEGKYKDEELVATCLHNVYQGQSFFTSFGEVAFFGTDAGAPTLVNVWRPLKLEIVEKSKKDNVAILRVS